MATKTAEPREIDESLMLPESPAEADGNVPFKPLILRNIEHPNEKLMRSEIITETGPNGEKRRFYVPRKRLEFVNTYIRVDNQADYDHIVASIPKSQLFIEPVDSPIEPQTYEENGKIVFQTRNPKCFAAFVKKMMS